MSNYASTDEDSVRHVDACFITPKKNGIVEAKEKSPSFNSLLKQVHQYHNRKIRQLCSKLAQLQRQLQEAEIAKWDHAGSATQYIDNKCPNCESNTKLLQSQRVKYEKKLQEKDRTILELRNQLQSIGDHMVYRKKRRLECCNSGQRRCEARRTSVGQRDNDCSELHQLKSPPSTIDRATAGKDSTTIRIEKQPYGQMGLFQNDGKVRKLTIAADDQSDSNLNENISSKFMPVPETAIENVDGGHSDLIIMETLAPDLMNNFTQSPIMHNDLSQIITSHTSPKKKLNSPNGPLTKCGKQIFDSGFSHSTPHNSHVTVSKIDSRKEFPAVLEVNMNFQNLCRKDLSKSFEEFQECSMKNKQPINTNDDSKYRQVVGEINVDNNAQMKSFFKLRLSSPSSKYKMIFEPATKDQKMIKYKQTTLTQNMSYTPTQAASSKSEDEELQQALAESLKENCNKNNVNETRFGEDCCPRPCMESATDVTSDNRMHQATHNNESHVAKNNSLDCTYVPTQIIKKGKLLNETSNNDQCEITYVSPRLLLSSFNKTKDTTELDVDLGCQETRVKTDDANIFTEGDSNDSEDLLKEIGQRSLVHTFPQQQEPGAHDAVSVSNCADTGTGTFQKEHLDDFDVVPKKCTSPKYKYKHGPVRQQDERRKLDGHECRECTAYFEAMKLNDEEKRKRLKMCSRHREKYPGPETPEHFWSVQFPTTQECKDRGAMNHTQYRPLQRRRNRK